MSMSNARRQREAKAREELLQLKRAKRAAAKVKWPTVEGKPYQGTIMWCPACYAELRRIPEGETVPPVEQHRIFDEHKQKCPRLKMRLV